MIISIGILAWNEAEVMATTLRSLLEQSLVRELAQSDHRLELVVVPNGCSDLTEQVATETLTAGAAALPAAHFTWRVQSLTEAGKANAWNQYVHQLSDPAADYLFLMDADIQFTHPDTLKNMLLALERDAHASVATDLPQKHVLFKARKTLFDRISLGIGQMTQAAPAQVTGQLFCARGPLLRRIHMPPGLITEDGFIKHMVCTGMFTGPSDDRRIVRAPNASHVFESYTRIADIFNNQCRQQVAQAIYVFLRDYLKAHVGAQDAGEIIAANNARDPDWYRALIRERVKQGGRWVMYPGAFGLRFRRLRNLSPPQALLKLPVAIVGFLMDSVVLVAANRRLWSGQLKGIWKDTKSYALAGAKAPVSPGAMTGDKVAHVMRRFVRDKWGGTESVVFNLASEYERAGIASPIFCTDMFAAPGAETVDNVSVRRFAYLFPWLFLGKEAKAKLRLKGGSPLSFGLFRALYREPRVALIHAHAQHRLGGIARTVARLRRIPYVVSIHGGYLTLPEEQSRQMQDPFRGKPEWGKLFGWLLGARRVLDDADAIICVGRDEHVEMTRRYGDKAHYVPNGVRTGLFRSAEGAAFRNHAGLQPGEKLALCVSRIDYQKNQLLLVRAFARFAARRPEWKLALIGAVTVESYRDQILAEVKRAGLESRVILIPGFAPDDPRLSSAYKAADVFVLPTVHEPFGIVILEAWAAGTPVIATRIGGIPGFTHDGEDILLFPKDDEAALLGHLDRLADDAALRARLVARATQEVTQYDWSSVARHMLSIYAAAQERHRRRNHA